MRACGDRSPYLLLLQIRHGFDLSNLGSCKLQLHFKSKLWRASSLKFSALTGRLNWSEQVLIESRDLLSHAIPFKNAIMMPVSTIYTTIHTCHCIYSSLLVVLGYTSDASYWLLFSLKAISAWLILPGICNLHWPCDSRRATANSLTWDCLSRCKETQGVDLSWSMGSMWHWRKVSQALKTSTYPETYPETGNPVKFLEETRNETIFEQTIPMVQKQKRHKSHGLHTFKSSQTGSPLHQEVRPFTFTGGDLFQTSHMLKLVVSRTKEEINAITYNQNAITIHIVCIYVGQKLYNQQQFNKKQQIANIVRLEGCRHLWCDDQKAQKAPTVHWTFPADRPMVVQECATKSVIRKVKDSHHGIYRWFFIHDSWLYYLQSTFINITQYLNFFESTEYIFQYCRLCLKHTVEG